MKITSKAEFFRLWEAGVLGNRPHLFHSAAEAHASGFSLIGFRQLGPRGGGAWCRVPRHRVYKTAEKWSKLGVPFIMDSGTAPAGDANITLQGEVCRTCQGLVGLLGVTPGFAMRPALQRGLLLPRTSATVLALLHRYMDPSSQDDLEALLDLYPDAVVEFTCFSRDTGIIPGRNTIFWEVRDY